MKSLFAALIIVTAACANKPSSHECASGIVCPDPLQCAAVEQVCISNSCGNGIVDPGEVCDDGNIENGDGCSADCKSKESCGDGVVNTQAGEVCDDGNTISGDGCSADCKSLETCGNGIVDTAKGEVCDDGNTHAGKCGDDKPCDTNSDCTVGACTPDGCSGDCKSNETCGNGIKDLGEVCDDGGAPGGCEDNCLAGVGCGNGMLDGSEECDDGNLVDTDDCTANCKINVCGDGILDSTGNTHHETCDPGSNGVPLETANCNLDCTTPSCGDGKVNLHFKPDGVHTEQCDLGSTGATNNNGDDKACTAACQINVCGDGKKASTEACDHGVMNGTMGDTCDTDCKVVGCGNGIVDFGEQCDPRAPVFTSPNDNTQTATCDSDCTFAFCGDTTTNSAAGEVCDQGTANGTACGWSLNATTCVRCASDCKTVNNAQAAPFCGDGKTDVGHEICDQGADNGTPCPYGTSCSRCDATCAHLNTQAGPSCGDNVVTAVDNEQCDGTSIPKTCLQLGYASGTPLCFAPGTPNQCHYDVTPCVPTCGNGVVEAGEQCDTTVMSATCNANCTKPVCGDGITNTFFAPDGVNLENCDNGINNDDSPNCPTYNTSCLQRCSSNCRLFSPHEEVCGDNVVDAGHETCDDGNTSNGVTECGYPSSQPCDACHACTLVLFPAQSCGDHIVQAGHEDCEPPSTSTCSSKCKTPTCGDLEQDGVETDVDCGGTLCDGNGHKCGDTLHCLVPADCQSGVCTGVFCSVPTCSDGVQNGTETGVDCGNAACKLCAGATCSMGTDCHSGSCTGNVCDP